MRKNNEYAHRRRKKVKYAATVCRLSASFRLRLWGPAWPENTAGPPLILKEPPGGWLAQSVRPGEDAPKIEWTERAATDPSLAPPPIRISKGFHNISAETGDAGIQRVWRRRSPLSVTPLDTDHLLKIWLDQDHFRCLGKSKTRSEIRHNSLFPPPSLHSGSAGFNFTQCLLYSSFFFFYSQLTN